MSTVAQLIALADSFYPNGMTDAQVVAYMNMAQNELSPYFGLVAEDNTLFTVADCDIISMPAAVKDIANIISLDISRDAEDRDKIVTLKEMSLVSYAIADQPDVASRISITHEAVGLTDDLGTVIIEGTVGGIEGVTETVTPVANTTVYSTYAFTQVDYIDSSGWSKLGSADYIYCGVAPARYQYDRYYPANLDATSYSSNVVYQEYTTAGVKSLVLYPAPSENGCQIKIKYRKALTALSESSTKDSPDFDSEYHDMLAMYAASMIAGSGASPDTIQADHYMKMFNERKIDIWKRSMEKNKISMKMRRDNRQWHS